MRPHDAGIPVNESDTPNPNDTALPGPLDLDQAATSALPASDRFIPKEKGLNRSPNALAIEPAHAAAETLAALLGIDLDSATAAQMSEANAALLDFRPEGLMKTMARNLVVTQALSMKLIKDAAKAKNPQAQAALLRVALSAQRETREILVLMRQLQKEAKAPETIDG